MGWSTIKRLLSDAFTFSHGLNAIIVNITNSINFIHISCTFKMVIQTTIVKVNRSDYCFTVIADKDFSMDKSWCVEIDLNT